MKKLIVTTIALSVIATSAFSQGLVNYSAGTSAATRMSTNSVVGGAATGLVNGTAASGGGLYYFALFASSTQTTINGSTTALSGISPNYVFNNMAGWTLVGIGTNNTNPGRISPATQGNTSANQGALNADSSLTVSGIAGAAAANTVSVGWLSTGIGTTVAALTTWYNAGAVGGWIGQSAIGNVTLGDGVSTSTPNPWGSSTGQVGGLLLGLTPSVPEPGTLALAALGVGSLLALRRKK